MTPDEAIAAVQDYGGTVMKTTLSKEPVTKLQDETGGADADQRCLIAGAHP
jgi:hypothetical protein